MDGWIFPTLLFCIGDLFRLLGSEAARQSFLSASASTTRFDQSLAGVKSAPLRHRMCFATGTGNLAPVSTTFGVSGDPATPE